ncbi:MAG: DUF3048 C-terminal domain-containing protein, partial [Oscillospiraceae bacterium]
TKAYEHCSFTSGKLIDEILPAAKIKRDLTTNVKSAFNFVPEGETVIPTTGDASNVKYSFSGSGDGDFRYDEATKKYLKWQYGKKQIDAGNTQLAFDNVFLLFAPISPIEGTKLVKVDYTKGGDAYYFSQGKYEKCTWSKGDYSENFVFKTASGEELTVNPGITHVGIVRNDRTDKLVIS